jgi:phosphopantothenoylcysteine decarboxylase/phosphopantothenate--cysteine ligase
VVVSAGPTFEDIDSVRFIGNRSSGRMGYAIAAEATRRGARVVLVSGPTHIDAPAGVEVIGVRSAEDMYGAVRSASADADIVVMAAAVADYTPKSRVEGKIEKSDGPLELELVPTPDILSELSKSRGGNTRPVLVGFAAENGDPVRRGREKFARKGVDLIIANDISRQDAGFDSDTNAATLISATTTESFPLGPKTALAATILDTAERLLDAVRS